MSEFDEFEGKSKDIREQILDLVLDEVAERDDLLEYDVKPFLRKSSSKRSKLDQEILEEKLMLERDEDVWSNRKPDGRPVPKVDLSDRSRHHFQGRVGKIFAFNLLYEVTDDDLKTLFGAFGPLKRAAINYTRMAQSMGTALIVFENRADAQQAFKSLDGHPLDGRKLCLRLLDGTGMRNGSQYELKKNRGDERPIDYQTVFENQEKLSKEDLIDLDLDSYVNRRKRAKTWNYY